MGSLSELHLRAKHAMRPETLDELLSAMADVSSVDRQLYGTYVEWLERKAAGKAGVTAMVAERLRSLPLPGSD